MDDAGGYQSLTYRELGRRLGITKRAAEGRALRARWTRVLGNDGIARVQVPDSALVPTDPTHATTHEPAHVGTNADHGPHTVVLTGAPTDPAHVPPPPDPVIAVLAAQVADLQARLDKAEATVARAAGAVATSQANLAKALDMLAQAQRPWWQKLLVRVR